MENRETRLISGKGQYADDLDFPGMAHLVFVGSPHGHAVIKRLAVDKALKVPGVLTVITGEEMVKYTNPLPVTGQFQKQGMDLAIAPCVCLPKDKVRWYGEPVAAVVAEDEKQPGKRQILWKLNMSPWWWREMPWKP